MTTVFKGAQVIDGTGGAARLADILVDEGRMKAVGDNLTGDDIVDVSGHTIIPGLFDCHVHIGFTGIPDIHLDNYTSTPYEVRILQFPTTAQTFLDMGITTVRDAMGAGLGLKQAVERGIVVGPRMQISIEMLSMTGGHGDGYLPYGANPHRAVELPGFPGGICDGVEGCIRKVREVIRAGADVIKISASGGFMSPNDDPEHPNFLQEEMDAIVKTASDLGRPVMAHAHGTEAIKRAIRAGVRSIEHGTFLDEEAAQMMIDNGTWLVPTLTTGDTADALAEDPGLPEAVRKKFAGLGHPERDMFKMAIDMGVKVAMGTDSPVAPHGTNLRELEIMTDLGLPAERALVAGTSSAAGLTGLSADLGTIAEGKIADLVIVEGDPYDYPTLKDRIAQVWKAGSRVV